HVLAEVDVRYSRIALDDEHVLVIGSRTRLAEIRRASHDQGGFGERVDQHEFQVNPLNVHVSGDPVEFTQPLIETVEWNAVAYRDDDIRSALQFPDGRDLRILALSVVLLLHQAEPEDGVVLAVHLTERI